MAFERYVWDYFADKVQQSMRDSLPATAPQAPQIPTPQNIPMVRNVAKRDVLTAMAEKPASERASGTPWLIILGIGVGVVAFVRMPGPSGHQNF